MGDEEKRTLTDEDVHAIAVALERRIVNRFFGSVGRGIWSLAWKGGLLVLVGFAALGAFKSPH